MKIRKLVSIPVVLMCVLGGPSTATAEEIEIVGTGDGVTVLDALGSAFCAKHPGNEVKVPKSIGSGGGIKAVGKDEQKIGRVARGIKEKEKHFGLSYAPFAKVPVVFFTHREVGVQNITGQQALDIYSGKISNWSAVGGPDLTIRVVRREDGDSSLSVLRETFPGFKELELTEKSKTVYSTPESIQLVESKSGAVGFGPYDVARSADVTVLKVDGMDPTDTTYPSATTLGLVYKEQNKTGVLGDFISFATSSDAHATIAATGGVPF
ncbi:MAG: substrate-binding domain-containing protein [Gammaproteobacteria bacterium]|nr:substrate-binding domain-containing protein [Gammaproteobacteria bacterium]